MSLTWQKFIDDPQSFKVWAVKMTPYKKYSVGWTLDSGAVYKKTYSPEKLNQSNPVAVRHNAARLTLAASYAALAAGTWFFDAATSTIYVWLAGGANPNGADVYLYADFRFCTASQRNYFDTAGNDWRDHVVTVPTITRGRSSTLSKITTAYGRLEIFNGDGYWDDLWLAWIWDSVGVEIYVTGYVRAPLTMAEDWLPWADSPLILKGLASREKHGTDHVDFKISDLSELLTVVFPLKTYDTTTYPNLDPNAAGNFIHRGYGVLKGIEAVKIDTTGNGTYKIDDEAVTSFDAIYDEDGATLATSSTDAANAKFTLSTVTTKRVFANYTKNIGSSPYNRAGTIKKHILQNVLGIASADIYAASYSTLDTDRPYALGISIPDARPIDEIFAEINKSVLAEDNTNRSGQFTTSKISKPGAGDPNQQTYTEYNSVIGDYDIEVKTDNVYAGIYVGYGRNHALDADAQYQYTEGAGAGNDYALTKKMKIETALLNKTDADAIAAAYKPFIDAPEYHLVFNALLKPLAQHVSQTVTFADAVGYGSHWKILKMNENAGANPPQTKITVIQ